MCDQEHYQDHFFKQNLFKFIDSKTERALLQLSPGQDNLANNWNYNLILLIDADKHYCYLVWSEKLEPKKYETLNSKVSKPSSILFK